MISYGRMGTHHLLWSSTATVDPRQEGRLRRQLLQAVAKTVLLTVAVLSIARSATSVPRGFALVVLEGYAVAMGLDQRDEFLAASIIDDVLGLVAGG